MWHDAFLVPIEPRVVAAFALRFVATGIVPADEPGMLRFARVLAERFAAVAQREHWATDPAFPGLSAGVERTGGGNRLIFATRLRASNGEALGVVFTVLIGDRRPEVTVAPAGAPIPPGWGAANV